MNGAVLGVNAGRLRANLSLGGANGLLTGFGTAVRRYWGYGGYLLVRRYEDTEGFKAGQR